MSVYVPSSQASARLRVSFFDLSRELRDYCYSLALTSPTPIIVWSGIPANPKSIKAKWDFSEDVDTASQFKTATSGVRNTVSGLLRCNSIILHEATLFFYNKNQFVFAGNWTWETVATWLKDIGLRNRNFVTAIELWQHQPSHAWQTATGERVRVCAFASESWEVPFPRNPHLHRLADSTSEGLVETINPAIETAFKLLGDKRPSKLLLTISLRQSFIPGIEIDLGHDVEFDPESWFSMDLPNVIEKLRTIYAANSVDVIWKGERGRDSFLKNREQIETHWTILELEEFDWVRRYDPLHWVRFTLRRKELPGLLLADEPAPFSGWGYCSIEDISSPGLQAIVHF